MQQLAVCADVVWELISLGKTACIVEAVSTIKLIGTVI